MKPEDIEKEYLENLNKYNELQFIIQRDIQQRKVDRFYEDIEKDMEEINNNLEDLKKEAGTTLRNKIDYALEGIKKQSAIVDLYVTNQLLQRLPGQTNNILNLIGNLPMYDIVYNENKIEDKKEIK